MNTRELTEEQFLTEIEEHQMTVLMDNGVYRHLRFKQPNSSCMFFDIVTWPGFLAYSGDMGCFVFSRVNDMLDFFRGKDDGPLKINRGYWSEKLEAVDGSRSSGSAKEYSPEKFKAVIEQVRLDWIRDYREQLDKEARRELWEAVDEEVLTQIHDGEFLAYQAANEFIYEHEGETWCFEDLWDHDFTVYTHRFTWCCYALVWAIREYDSSTAKKEAA